MANIQDLPPEILEMVFKHFDEWGHTQMAFALSHKQAYQVLLALRSMTATIKTRDRRLNKWRKNRPTDKMSIVLDRLYEYNSSVVVVARAYMPIDKDYEVYAHISANQWQNMVVQTMVCDIKGDQLLHKHESLWVQVIDYQDWFALCIKDQDGNEFWDNNDGWNYTASQEYHHIPYIFDYNMSALIEFSYTQRINFYIPFYYDWIMLPKK